MKDVTNVTNVSEFLVVSRFEEKKKETENRVLAVFECQLHWVQCIPFAVEDLGMFAALSFHPCDLRYMGSKQLKRETISHIT
jgi:hypothetical protein